MIRDFRSAYEEHAWDVFGFLAYRTTSRQDAEDLTQLTFERALRAWGRFDPERASGKTWLLAIARNALIDQHRRSRAEHETSLDLAQPAQSEHLVAPGPEDSLSGLSPELASAMKRLGDAERDVLALRFGGDLVSAEIASMLGLTVANVHQITSRALRKLRAELQARQHPEAVRRG